MIESAHELHSEVSVMEEILEAGAEVVEPGFSIRGGDKPILGALTVAGKAHVAFRQ